MDILDGVSQNSAEEGSNTDSGRGPSEPDAVAAGGTTEHNGNMRQYSTSLQTGIVTVGSDTWRIQPHCSVYVVLNPFHVYSL